MLAPGPEFPPAGPTSSSAGPSDQSGAASLLSICCRLSTRLSTKLLPQGRRVERLGSAGMVFLNDDTSGDLKWWHAAFWESSSEMT